MKLIVRRIMLLLLAAAVFCLNGCMRFTDRDYELQKNSYEKQRQQQEEEDKNSFLYRW